MLGLWCSVKTYHWGKRGSESLVARLAKRACRDFHVDEKTTYAEVRLPLQLSCLLLLTDIIVSVMDGDPSVGPVSRVT